MNEVSAFRLHLLRAMYLLVVVGLGIVLWPGILHHERPWELARGTVICMMAAFSVLCAFGLRYPLQMLPILLWEIVWKTMWLAIVALPQWLSGHIEAPVQQQIFDLSFVVLVYLVVPWGYVFKHYVKKPGDALWQAKKRAPHAAGAPIG
ncbi:MAG: hypothetical protein V4484_05635 [Pseudomonadota bacterium]